MEKSRLKTGMACPTADRCLLPPLFSDPRARAPRSIGAQIGSAAVPGHSAYVTYMTDFSRIWREATNTSAGWSIARTPKGLTMPNWAKWGSLRYASNAAFTFLLRAQQLPAGNAVRRCVRSGWGASGAGSRLRAAALARASSRSNLTRLLLPWWPPPLPACLQDRTAFIAFAKRNLDYCLGSTGRSFVVGVGTNPPRNVSSCCCAAAAGTSALRACCRHCHAAATPLRGNTRPPAPCPPRLQPHHASASCPVTGTCGWSFFDSPTPNTNVCTNCCRCC